MKSITLTISFLIVFTIIAIIIFVFSGAFNVSAGWKEPAFLEWIMEETRENSIKSRASSIDTKGMITGSKKQIEDGFRSYREMCVTCHLSPGQDPSPVAVGLNPPPPNLTSKREHEMSDAELFWVIKNGIRMTGMPAWGPTHKDDEIWAIVALLKVLPEISPADYRILDSSLSPGHSDVSGEAGAGHADTQNNEAKPAMGQTNLQDHNAAPAPHPPANLNKHSDNVGNDH
ncbi:MAG: cytochrome c [Gammaproteobacteria bacterium]|nr:cytochrome c [Gammaproteobacteria bacterium]